MSNAAVVVVESHPVHHTLFGRLSGGEVGDAFTLPLIGASGLKRRCNRSGATHRLWLLSVVSTNLSLVLGRPMCCCINLRPWSLPTRSPWPAVLCASEPSRTPPRPGR